MSKEKSQSELLTQQGMCWGNQWIVFSAQLYSDRSAADYTYRLCWRRPLNTPTMLHLPLAHIHTLEDRFKAICRNPRRLTQKEDTGQCAWSPDGSQLAFSSNRDGRYSIYIMDRDGSNVRQVTRGPAADSPDWSPDGLRIAYEGAQDQTRQIFVVNVDGTGTKALTKGKGNSPQTAGRYCSTATAAESSKSTRSIWMPAKTNVWSPSRKIRERPLRSGAPTFLPRVKRSRRG